jgi:nucleotide-binding universal stress UspA family protein
MAAKRRATSSVRRILHPTDFSTAAGPALAKAIALAKDNGAELLIVTVLDALPPLASEMYVSRQTYDRIAAEGRTAAQRRLDRPVARARNAGVRVRSRVLEGSAHEQIVRTAKRERCDLIVMGTHGRTGLTKLLIGSVAGRVIATAPCPVVTVRAR